LKHKLQKLKEESQALCEDISSDLSSVKSNLDQVAREYHRVTELSRTPTVVINDIDRQFEKATKLTGTDTAFLFVATGMQCIRQYVLTPNRLRGDANEEARNTDGHITERSQRSHKLYNPSIEEIRNSPVPFDVVAGTHGLLKGYGSLGHRGATVGHDPLWGLLFGTANIATSTVTLWGKDIPILMPSYHVKTGGVRGKGDVIREMDVIASSSLGNPIRADTIRVVSEFSDKLIKQGDAGREICAEALKKEIIHLKSDVYSKDSLPLPSVSALSPRLAGDLAKRGIDMANVLNAGKQLTYAVLIDSLIALIHSMFYAEGSSASRRTYEVRTRKILLYSNLLASSSNIIVSAISQYFGGNGQQLIDWGGYINTLRHIVFDTKFIYEVKKDFLKNELYDLIVGDDYDFMKGDF